MLNEKKLTKAELDKREDIIMKMKKNKRSLIDKYGKDAEAVMYGRATNMAKKQAESMGNNRLNELIKDALINPTKAVDEKGGKIEKVKKLLAKKKVDADDVSPNFVNDFAHENGITDLTSDQVVKISDTYAKGGKMDEDKDWIQAGEKSGEIKTGGLHKALDIPQGEKIPAGLINKKLAQLKKKDKDKGEKGVQGLSKADLKLQKQLNLAKSFKKMDETLDKDAWGKLDRLRDSIQDDDYIITSIMKAMSTDDANLYLDAMIRDHIDIVDDSEDFESYHADLSDLDNDPPISSKFTEPLAEDHDCEKIHPNKSHEEWVKSEIDNIKRMNPKTNKKALKKLSTLKDIKETIKQMRSINEKDYPFDKCLDDNEGKYGKEGAKKVCGSIRAAFGEGLDEGLPKGYFKKEFGIGKKKKLKEATGPATIEDTQKAARKVATAITSFEKESTAKVSHGLDKGSFDLDLNDETYEGGSYTVDSDGDITLVSIAKPSFIGNINDSPETIFRTMEDVLAKQDKEYSGGRYE